MWPWSTKPVLSHTGIFVAIANNKLYGSKLNFSLGYKVKIMFHENEMSYYKLYKNVIPD